MCRYREDMLMAQLDLSPSVPSSVAVSETLSNEQRQLALAILRTQDQPLALADLAEDIARAQQPDPAADPDYEAVRRLRLNLYHTHVPKLVDAGLVTYNARQRTVRYAAEVTAAAEVSPEKKRCRK